MNTIMSAEGGSAFGGKKYWPLILILVLGTALRFYNLTSVALWHDEAFSALMIKYPWREMFYRLGLDVHPPMYYIFLRLWSDVFGSSLWALRGFSVLFGVATIWASYLFVKTAFKSQKMALWTALLMAASAFQIQYVTEARMYTFGVFFAVLAAYFLIKAFHYHTLLYDSEKLNMPNLPEAIKDKRMVWWNYFGFAISMIIIVYTHYYLFFTAAALGIYGLMYLIFHHQGNWKKFLPLLLSFIVIFLAFLPWLKVFLFQLKQVGQSYWIPPMDIWSIPGTLWTMLLGFAHDNGNPTTRKLLIVVVLFTLFFLYRFIRKSQAFEKWLVLFGILAPFGGAILFALLAKLKGSNTSVYLERYFLFAGSFYIVAIAAWLSEIKTKGFGITLFCLYTLINLYAFVHYWQDLAVAAKPGMAAAAKFLGTKVETGHKVYVGTSFEFFNYKYYDQTYYPLPTRPLLYTGGRSLASQMSSVEGDSLLTDQDLLPDFAQATHTGDTVWLLWTNGFGSKKPEVPRTWIQVDQRGYADVRPYSGTVIYVTEYKVN